MNFFLKNQQISHHICLKDQFELFKGEIGGYTTAVIEVHPKFSHLIIVFVIFGKIFNFSHHFIFCQTQNPFIVYIFLSFWWYPIKSIWQVWPLDMEILLSVTEIWPKSHLPNIYKCSVNELRSHLMFLYSWKN